MNKGSENVVFISASQQTNIEELRTVLLTHVSRMYYTIYPNYLEDQVFTDKAGDI
jgi:50S ribosomal subunit-associated GTPase HflX